MSFLVSSQAYGLEAAAKLYEQLGPGGAEAVWNTMQGQTTDS